MRQTGLFGLSDHLKRLSAHGDPLEEPRPDHRLRGISPGSGFWLRHWPMATGPGAAVRPMTLW